MASPTTVIMQGYALLDLIGQYVQKHADDEPLLTVELASHAADIKAGLIALEEHL